MEANHVHSCYGIALLVVFALWFDEPDRSISTLVTGFFNFTGPEARTAADFDTDQV